MWCQAGEARELCRGVTAGLFCAALRTGSQPCGCHACRAETARDTYAVLMGRAAGAGHGAGLAFVHGQLPHPVRGYQLGRNGTRGQMHRHMICSSYRKARWVPTSPRGLHARDEKSMVARRLCRARGDASKGERDLGTDRHWQGAWGKKPSGNLTKTGRSSTQQIQIIV